ncbi:MAG: hypothetical protein IKQ09_03500 [Bacteroidales bacterium]|nr:hypothetical protein [Bacteroidales bacterium]
MALTLLIFGILSDTFLAALVGLVGARRRIGFGWAFFFSVLLTPFIGLIIALLSDKLPDGERNWGCLGSILAIITIALLVFLFMAVLGAAATA